MAKAFKKGAKVTVLSVWNRTGTFTYRQATVHSCGAKVLRLTCDTTGEEFGRELCPVNATQEGNALGVHERMTDEAAAEFIVKDAGPRYICSEIARMQNMMNRVAERGIADQGYFHAVQKDIDAYGDPVAVEYHAALKVIHDEFR